MAKITNIYLISSIVIIGGFLQGFDISSLAAILSTAAFKKYYHSPNANVQAGTTASISGGSFLGCIFAFTLIDRLGRKTLLQQACVIFVVGAVLCTASVDIAMLIVGRLICGFAVGIYTSVGPTYLAEISPRQIRGRIISLQQWSITWGALIMYYISFGASYKENTATFRIPWAIQIVPALIMLTGLHFVPRSPRWLASKDRLDEALQVLADLHGNGDPATTIVQAEFLEIKEAMQLNSTMGRVQWGELVEPKNFQRISIGIFVHIWTQLSGNNALLYYITYIFQMAGLTGNTKLIAASIQYVINVVMTLPAILFLDKVGRRPALLFGSVMMMTWLYATAGLLKSYGHGVPGGLDGQPVVTWVVHGPASKAVIASTYLLVATYSMTWAPISWIYPPEIYPIRLRGKVVSVATSANWMFGFAVSYLTPPSFQNLAWKTFLIFGTFNVAAGLHAFFFFPETKGKSLEDIDDMFAKGVKAWQSNFHKTDRLGELVQTIEKHGEKVEGEV